MEEGGTFLLSGSLANVHQRKYALPMGYSATRSGNACGVNTRRKFDKPARASSSLFEAGDGYSHARDISLSVSWPPQHLAACRMGERELARGCAACSGYSYTKGDPFGQQYRHWRPGYCSRQHSSYISSGQRSIGDLTTYQSTVDYARTRLVAEYDSTTRITRSPRRRYRAGSPAFRKRASDGVSPFAYSISSRAR